MATIVTKIIRVYPKNERIENIDCQKICSHLANSATELWEKVIYFINQNENCLDIKYKSRRGTGELGIEDEIQNYDIWITACGDNTDGFQVTSNENQSENKYGINLYKFDEIKILGQHEKLIRDFYPMFFYFGKEEKTPPYFLSKAIEKQFDNEISFNQAGVYTASNDYDIGKKHSLVPELVSEEEFVKLRGESSFIENFLFYPSHYYGLESLLKTVFDEGNQNQYGSDGIDNLIAIQFFYRKRVVKELKWEKSFWKFSSSDWWDNCISPEWIEYKTRKKTDENRVG